MLHDKWSRRPALWLISGTSQSGAILIMAAQSKAKEVSGFCCVTSPVPYTQYQDTKSGIRFVTSGLCQLVPSVL
jgi:hypothetical protein